MELHVALVKPLGLDAGDREGGNEEAILLAGKIDGGRVQHARAVVRDPAAVEGKPALPQADDAGRAAATHRRVEAERAVLERLEAAGEDHAVLVAGPAALVDAAHGILDAAFS